MNERFESLMYHAGMTAQGCWDEMDGYQREAVEKFAELIVQECINQVREQYKPVMEDAAMMKDEHWKGYVQCGVDNVVAIREHFFGVEQ